jgi:flagellar biosynthesis component FlhA
MYNYIMIFSARNKKRMEKIFMVISIIVIVSMILLYLPVFTQ